MLWWCWIEVQILGLTGLGNQCRLISDCFCRGLRCLHISDTFLYAHVHMKMLRPDLEGTLLVESLELSIELLYTHNTCRYMQNVHYMLLCFEVSMTFVWGRRVAYALAILHATLVSLMSLGAQ